MVRDFTEATKERLSKEIDDINKKTWCGVTDAIGDAISYAGKWLGILSLDDDMSNVKSYQRSVLDMTDMTKKELQEIFDKVYDIDKDYKSIFNSLNEYENLFNSKLRILYSLIKPNLSICDSKAIGAAVDTFNSALKNVNGKITEDFNNELDWAAKEAALKATKGFFGSALMTVVDVVTLPVSMIKNVVTGNPGGIFTDTWGIIDDVFAVGSNAVGLASLGIGYGISALTGNNQQKHLAITYGEAYGGVSGLTDVLGAEEKVNGKNDVTTAMKKISQIGDTASGVVGLFGDVKGFLKDPSSMVDFKFGFKGKLSTLKKADMIDKYQDDYRKWQSLYRTFGKSSHYTTLKNILNGYKYMESGWDLIDLDGNSNIIEQESKNATKGSQKWFGAFGDAYDLGEGIVNLFS